MGNANFAQPPKFHKEQNEGDADTGKSRQSANGSGKAANQSSQGQNGYKVDSRATNPFIIFFLRLRSKKPNEHVTVIARAAGKLWARMTPEQRKKYVDLANEEKKRRQDRKRKRKRSSIHSRVILRSALSITAIDVCPLYSPIVAIAAPSSSEAPWSIWIGKEDCREWISVTRRLEQV
ncbi:hypothetical protein G5I_00297 [Acromyrmex echinatior]|uniref:HMG box domain-containing protein n=1 Tax=Acromyrmex echinatior TaxID=103372 RepID=F4W4H6_ACREC|nr:hypothetical protein G5I_00297 [Acromyrmex echinatior]